MPIYEYRCNSCGHELEKLQRMSDDPLTVCPACQESGLRRLISPAGFRLKGSGWYETDFKSGNKRNVIDSASDKDSKTADSGDSGSKDSKKSESSPDSPKKEKAKTESAGKSTSKETSAT